ARHPDMAQSSDHRALIGIGETEPRREQGCKEDQRQNKGADHADLVARDPPPDGRPVTAGFCGRPSLQGSIGYCGADTHFFQLRLMRGSIAACAISTRRLRMTKNSASTRMVPCNSGRSRWKIAELSSRPEPGHENTVSIRIEPPSMYPSCSPITAIAVGAAFLMTWRNTWVSRRPLARRASTKSWLRISPVSARTVRVTIPIGITEVVMAGRIR